MLYSLKGPVLMKTSQLQLFYLRMDQGLVSGSQGYY